ncbi:unnamed protein product [Porites lobata]|uniref:carbonic anhydrase n=1 Tax=Porites lobata TaxID=104759 RepID=A0ABN8QXA5_9CNID|nr:unnamed protein product [Porites lobata]
MVSVIKLLVLFTTIGAVYSDSEGKWGYVNLTSDDGVGSETNCTELRRFGGQTGTMKGPEDWHDLELKKDNQCGGNRQSPINIKTSEVEEEDSYRRLKITFDNARGLVTGTLENTGHSPKLEIADSNGASLTGGPLGNNKFELIEFHVHFGCVNERGSEHKLNGKQLSGELHMVFGHGEEPRAVVAVWIKAWHYNHVTSTPIAKHFMPYCRLIYMLSMLYVRLMIKVKVKIPESFKVGWCPHKITGSSHLNAPFLTSLFFILKGPENWHELNLTDPNQPNHFGKNKQSPIDIKTSEVEEAIVPTVL